MHKYKALPWLLWLFITLGAGCSSSEGVGNLLAGQACDAFTLQSDPRCVCCSERGGLCISGSSPCAPEDASPTCGNRCPDGLECVTQDGKSVCGQPQPPACFGPSQVSCGNCGTQNRTCTNGNWSEWSKCDNEGVCKPGSAEDCEGGSRVCQSTCEWTSCQSCACQEGETRACEGGQQRCVGHCQWGPCYQDECQPGDTRQEDCGNCGKRTLTCSSARAFSAGPCEAEGECRPADFQACGGGNYHECDDSCRWGECGPVECTPGTSDSQDCGNCGTRTRDCVNGKWSDFGSCKTSGVCKPGTSQACGNAGTQTCAASCQWNDCTGQSCDGSPVELCGNCGFHSRTCSNGSWSSFGACTGERECLPGQTEACAGGSKTCGLDCYFGACQ